MSIQRAVQARLVNKPRNAALDGIRGVAIVAVIASHYIPGGFKGGAFGVLVFFVLSGFLITALLLKEYDATGKLDLKAFYARRALRLLPALYLFLLVGLGLAFVWGGPLRMDAQGAATGAGLAFLYVFNWADFAALRIPHAMTPLWTLSVEEQFYLLWPLVLLLLLGVPALQRRLQGIVLGAVAASTALGVAMFLVFGLMSFYRTWTWVGPLLLGAALAIAQRRTRGQAGVELSRFSPGAWCLLLLVALFPPALDSVVVHVVVVPLLSVATCAIIARSTRDPDTAPPALSTRLLSSAPLKYLGTRSYGLYLWNLLALEGLQPFLAHPVVLTACALALSFAMAELSYRWVEMPALRLKRRFERERLG